MPHHSLWTAVSITALAQDLNFPPDARSLKKAIESTPFLNMEASFTCTLPPKADHSKLSITNQTLMRPHQSLVSGFSAIWPTCEKDLSGNPTPRRSYFAYVH